MRKEERDVAARVAAEVRRARLAHGWSQLVLAEKAGLSLNYIGLIERAEQVPAVRVLLQIAATLGVSLGDLLTEQAVSAEPAERERDPWLSEAMGILRALPLDARPVAMGVLRGVAEATTPRAKPDGSGVRPKRRRT
jgi:XRE family transcriptional regulator, regulator of sulfur utilization